MALLCAALVQAAEFHQMPGDWYVGLGPVVPHARMRAAGGSAEVQATAGVAAPWRGLVGAAALEGQLAYGTGNRSRHAYLGAAYLERVAVDGRVHLGAGPVVGVARLDPREVAVQESVVAGVIALVGMPVVRHLDVELSARGTTAVESVPTAAIVVQLVWWP